MESINSWTLIILGFCVFLGMAGAWIFQKNKIPQVVGYIVIGFLIGESGFKLVGKAEIEDLNIVSVFALGIIGFLVGGELKIATFKKYARQFVAILVGEGMAAFLLVGGAVFAVMAFVTPNYSAALAAAIIFGAIASATDPASTIDVIWEYKSKGVLTTAIIAIVALDDALAMMLYAAGAGAAQILTGGSGSIMRELRNSCVEIGGALVLGMAAAFVLTKLVRRMRKPEKIMALTLGVILLVIGASVKFNMDLILSTMTLGFVLANLVPEKSDELFGLMRGFSAPIYILFFVFVGARLVIGNMPWWLWLIVVLYVLGRSFGKMAGTYFAAKLTGAAPSVKNYLGMGLFAQGGVAVGLSIMASGYLGKISIAENLYLGDVIICGVTATTLAVQLIGPPLVKLSLKLSGEMWRDVTEDDIMASMKVSDVMDRQIPLVSEEQPLEKVASMFRDFDSMVFPVVNHSGSVTGIISLESLKDVITDQDAWRWLLAADVMTQTTDSAIESDPLEKTYWHMRDMKIDQMPVLAADGSNKPVGMLDSRRAQIRIKERLILHQQAC